MVGPVTNSAGNEARIDVDYTSLTDIDSFARSYHIKHAGELFDIRVLALYCAAMRREVVDEVGELDERFGTGMFEDDDYAMRLHQLGYRVVCAEDVFVHHFGRSSFSKMQEEQYLALFDDNLALFEAKWGASWQRHKYREGLGPVLS